MKKFLKLLLTLTLLLTLVACQGDSGVAKADSEGTGKEESAVSDDGKIHIRFWYAWKDKIGENNENLVKQFNESQDKIVVEAEYQGSYDELHSKTQAAFVAGNAPEVTENEIASMGVFARGGMTENLTPFVTEDLNLEDFNKGLMGNAYVDGDLYGLPYLRSTPILYKNVDMLEAAGLDPAGPRDWKEFKEYLQALRKDDTYGLTMTMNNWIYEAFVGCAGGSMFEEDGITPAFNKEPGVKATAFWKELHDEDLVKLNVGEQAAETQKQDFANQKAAMFFTSTADLTYNLGVAEEQGFTVDVSFIPKDVRNAVPTGGCNVVMTAGLSKEKQEAAWEFIKWLTDTEQTAYASSYTGYLPSRYSALETDKMKKLYEEYPQFKVAVDQLEYGQARPMVEGYTELSKFMMDEMTKLIVDGEGTPQECMDKVAKQAKTILKK
jgi:sn-glycerol 3-phosphate transport system substrate-binding protein